MSQTNDHAGAKGENDVTQDLTGDPRRIHRGAPWFTERLARTSALHPWRTIAVWAALIVPAVLAAGSLLGSGLTSESKFRAGEPDSVTADA